MKSDENQSGAGMSVGVNELLAKHDGDQKGVFVIDTGQSYKALCASIGGTPITLDPKAPTAILPPPTALPSR